MEDHRSMRKGKQVEFTEASTPTVSKRPTADCCEELFESQSEDHDSELPLFLPSWDSSEKVNVPSASKANSDPSTSSTSLIVNNYYVFLSFRGPDTRNGFVDHLYHRLKDVGLRFHPNFVFRDDKDLPFGEDIGTNLIGAIEHSKVSIPVISKNYAASKWCLRELIHIMECKKSRGQIVLPVLYKVKPKDVRHLEGSFGEAFQSCKDQFEEEVKQQGPVALRKAVDSRIFESDEFAHGHEAELVNELVDIVLREWQTDFQPRLPVNLVGIDNPVGEVMKLADVAHQETRVIWIWGMGGIGKTTLATIIYNRLFDKFQCRSFLKDIRETISRNGIEYVQSRLISDITKNNNQPVPYSDIGIQRIQSSCPQNKVLIFLDDVDHQDHLDNLIGGCKFLSESRIIITSRHMAIKCQDKAMLESTYWYELQEMNRENSFLLFRIHAFEGKPPPKELATLSRDIVATTRGLPLALMVIGSLLRGEEDQTVWRETLEKLRNAPNETVQEKLRISYDSLKNKEKKLFLDIACLFIGTDKRIATYLWEDLKLFPRIGLQILTNRSLIKIDEENKLRMHDQLRDLGRAIACPEDTEPWHWSRLQDEKAIKVLQRKEKNENIEALHLDKRGSREFVEQESFKRLPNLKYLHTSDMEFAGDFEESLSELRWLESNRCSNSFRANNVHLEKLLILDLTYSNIGENWKGWSLIKMERLKVLNLSSCSNLKSTPNLSVFKSLEILTLEDCFSLKKIDPSIGDVKCLVSLNLRFCISLENLPTQLGELRKLEQLIVDGTAIKEIPTCVQFLTELKMLSAVGCRLLTRVPSSISHLVNLSTLNLNHCLRLQELPDSFEALGKLRRLLLGHCWLSKQIPSSIGKLGELVELDLSYTGVKELPESIGKLKKLKILRIFDSEIKKLPSTIGQLESLQVLDASFCHELEGEILVDKGGLSSLRTLCLRGAKISRCLPKNFHELSSLDHLDLLYCWKLEPPQKFPSGLSSLQLTCWSDTLPSLSRLSHLKELFLHYCDSLRRIPELPPCIQKLRVWECPKLERLPNLSDLKSLLELELLRCYGLKELDGLGALESLRKLDLSSITEFYWGEGDDLHEISGLGQLKSLQVLDISGRKHIQQLDLSNSMDLKQLIVKYCRSLQRIDFHSSIETLERFHAVGCQRRIIHLFSRRVGYFQRERAAKS